MVYQPPPITTYTLDVTGDKTKVVESIQSGIFVSIRDGHIHKIMSTFLQDNVDEPYYIVEKFDTNSGYKHTRTIDHLDQYIVEEIVTGWMDKQYVLVLKCNELVSSDTVFNSALVFYNLVKNNLIAKTYQPELFFIHLNHIPSTDLEYIERPSLFTVEMDMRMTEANANTTSGGIPELITQSTTKHEMYDLNKYKIPPRSL